MINKIAVVVLNTLGMIRACREHAYDAVKFIVVSDTQSDLNLIVERQTSDSSSLAEYFLFQLIGE